MAFRATRVVVVVERETSNWTGPNWPGCGNLRTLKFTLTTVFPFLLYAMRAQSGGGGGGCVGVGCLMRILVPALIDKGKKAFFLLHYMYVLVYIYNNMKKLFCDNLQQFATATTSCWVTGRLFAAAAVDFPRCQNPGFTLFFPLWL